jgi:acyl-CoA synthetase (AMP-forming)/AMP-acid ligase II
MQVGALIRRAALHFRDAPCLVEGSRVVSFREFDALTDRLGNALLALGLEHGDRVGVLMPNGINCLVVYYALAKSVSCAFRSTRARPTTIMPTSWPTARAAP